MMPGSLLVALLSFAPAADAAAEPPPPSASAGASTDEAAYQGALDRVRTAQNMANDDPERGAVQLRDALQLLQDYGPTLAKDPEGQDLRTMAQLTLARALFATDDADGAREAMDDAIRTGRGDPLPAKQFGPGLAALYKERNGVLAKLGTGSIEVECRVACRVYINERPTGPKTTDLVPGTYRVWIEATDGSEPPTRAQIDLAEGLVAPLEFGTPPVVDPGDAPDKPVEAKAKRIMPRWAEIVLMSAGAAAIGTGATLWAIDGNCPSGAQPEDWQNCPTVYTTKAAGITTLAVGGAVFLTGTITLAVDEVRVGRTRGNEVALMWTMRF